MNADISGQLTFGLPYNEVNATCTWCKLHHISQALTQNTARCISNFVYHRC